MSKIQKTGILSKDFILFFVTIAQASFGSSVATVALAFLVLKVSGSASAMAMTLGLRILPTVFMPFMATFLDRVNVKIPLILSFVLRGVLLILLYFGVQAGVAGVYIIYWIALINGILATISMPSCQILIPSLLAKADLERGNSVLNMAEQSMSLVGYLCGGALVSLFGPMITVLIEGVCYLICGLFVMSMALQVVVHRSEHSFLRDVWTGIKIMHQFKVVALTTLMCFFINVFFALVEVYLPLHMQAIAKGGAGYGVFMTCMMIGMLGSSSLMAWMGTRYKSSFGIALGWIGLALAFFGLGGMDSFYACLVWSVLLGVGISFINTSIRIILQKTIAHRYRGRVNGMSNALSSIGMPIAFILISYTMQLINFQILFVVGACFALIFALFWFFYVKSKPAVYFEQEFIGSVL